MFSQIGQRMETGRDDLCICAGQANSRKLGAITQDRNSAAKSIRHARIVLATAKGHDPNAAMRPTGEPKPCMRCGQEPCVELGDDGILRDNPRSCRVPLMREAMCLAAPPSTTSHGAAIGWREAVAAETGATAWRVGPVCLEMHSVQSVGERR